MTAWISAPFETIARTAIRTLHFFLSALCFSPRTFCNEPYDIKSGDGDSTESASMGVSLLTRLSHHILPSNYDDRTGEAIRLLRETKTSDPFCYSAAMDALVRAGRCREAEAVFSRMLSSGILPDSVTYSILVKMHCFHRKHFASALHLIELMRDRGCEPDVVTYSTVIAGLSRSGKLDDAFAVLHSMLKIDCVLNAHVYTPILQAYCAQGKLHLAAQLLERMRAFGCPPDVVSYNVLIHALCKNGNFQDVDRILAESSENGWEPDSVSYNTYISGLCSMGMTDKALKQLDVMLSKALHPTDVTLNILLGLLCRRSNFVEIVFFLEKSLELGLPVGAATYNTAMTRLCEIGEFSAVLNLLSDMFKKRIQPDVQTFNIVILSLCRAGRIDKAKSFFKSRGFSPDIVTCNILLHEFCLAGEFDEFYKMLAEMSSGQVSPDAITYNIIVDGLCWDGKYSKAIEFVKSINFEFKSDHVAHLAFGLVKGGRVRDLLKLLEDMIEEGVILDPRVFEFMIQAFCKKGSCESIEIYKICLILDMLLGRK